MPVLGVVDNTNPDNLLEIFNLMSPFFRLIGVVVTGRAAAEHPTARLDEISRSESQFRTLLNAVRMLNFMDVVMPGHDIPVFCGTPAPKTIVPHNRHVDELRFNDLHDGQLELIRDSRLHIGPKLGALGLAGAIGGARKFLRSEAVNEYSMIVGGPMTDVDKLLRDQLITEKTQDIYTQFGMCGFGEQQLMQLDDNVPRGQRQFNVACDPGAAHRVLTRFPRAIHLYPSDVTRVNSIGFPDGEAFQRFLPDNHAARHMGSIYRFAYHEMIEPRGPQEMIWLHDAAPGIGRLNHPAHRRQPTGREVEIIRGPYAERPVFIRHVPHTQRDAAHHGEIWLSFIESPAEVPETGQRYVAHDVDPPKYLQAVYDLTAWPQAA